jgi:hypothetical protein
MTLPWEKRKRKCENCKSWLMPDDPQYMGRCEMSVRDNGFFSVPSNASYLYTGHYFHCMLWQRKESPNE